MPFHHHTLPNGLEIVGESNPAALSVALAVWVRTGARDEPQELAGVSHFLEHMIFKGSEKRDALAINRDYSKIGADNNAWTSEENTVFHAVVLPEYLPQLVDVLMDMMRPSLRESDFVTEKDVILPEIARYQVQPGSATFELAQKAFYGEHPLGNSVLGTKETITAMARDQMAGYFEKRYVASNMHVVVSGNFDFPHLVQLVEKACGHWPKGQTERANRRETPGQGGVHVYKRPVEKVTQQYLIMMAPSPAADAALRYPAGVLATAIGDYTGSRLFWAINDPGLADEVGMGAMECDAAGAYVVSLNCPPENMEECYSIVRGILDDVQKDGITEDELKQAKTKILSRQVRGGERTARRMIAVGNDWAYLKQYRSVDDELKAIDAVDLKSVREVLSRYPITAYTTTTLGPLEAFAGVTGTGS